MVVVLSVGNGKIPASHTYSVGTSWHCPQRFVTKRFRVVTEPADARLVLAEARRLGLLSRAPVLAAGRAQHFCADLLGVFPHQELVRPPPEMESEDGDPNGSFTSGSMST
jgi:hypothetical protein